MAELVDAPDSKSGDFGRVGSIPTLGISNIITTTMKLNDFDYHLPEDRIARYPTVQRVDSRLLTLNSANGEMNDLFFKELPTLLRPNDCLIFNDTRVMKARLYGRKATGGRVELLVERLRDTHEALCHMKGSKGVKEGALLHFGTAQAKFLGRAGNCVWLRFDTPVLPLLAEQGEIPLPHYMQREPEPLDDERYQTVYAKHMGAVAAPTAGLHFDEALLKQLAEQGVLSARVTLHVGAGTFQPVKVDDITQHEMHAEWAQVPLEVCETIRKAKAAGGRVIAVGTTSLRALESAASSGELQPFEGDTRLFIYPGYEFKIVDALITNFHLPKSSLLMLVSAFAGYDPIRHAYQHALAHEYRFFSYGDAMLLTKRLHE